MLSILFCLAASQAFVHVPTLDQNIGWTFDQGINAYAGLHPVGVSPHSRVTPYLTYPNAFPFLTYPHSLPYFTYPYTNRQFVPPSIATDFVKTDETSGKPQTSAPQVEQPRLVV
jgi:hypothetical protein